MSKRFRENAFRILKSVYYMEDPKKITKEIKKNNVSGNEFVKILLYLKNKGLVSYKDLEIPVEISLTDKGMEYVVSELKQERQEEFNMVVAFTGTILALIGIYNFIVGNFSFEDYPMNLVVIKTIFLFLLFICIGPLVIIIINYWKREVFGR